MLGRGGLMNTHRTLPARTNSLPAGAAGGDARNGACRRAGLRRRGTVGRPVGGAAPVATGGYLGGANPPRAVPADAGKARQQLANRSAMARLTPGLRDE